MRRISILAVLVALAFAFAGNGEAQAPPAVPANAVDLWDDYVPGPTTVQAVRLRAGVRPAGLPPASQATSIEGSLPSGTNPKSGPSAFATASSAVCFSSTQSVQRGTWPVQQKVLEARYWCAHSLGGTQYYRESHVRGETTLCSWDKPYHFKVAGGNGWRFTNVQSGISTSCPTPYPWITLHHDLWQQWSCNTYGNCEIRGHNADSW